MGESTRQGAGVPPIQAFPDPAPARTPRESAVLVLVFGALAVVAVTGIGTYGIPYAAAAALAGSVACLETWSMIRQPDPAL